MIAEQNWKFCSRFLRRKAPAEWRLESENSPSAKAGGEFLWVRLETCVDRKKIIGVAAGAELLPKKTKVLISCRFFQDDPFVPPYWTASGPVWSGLSCFLQPRLRGER